MSKKTKRYLMLLAAVGLIAVAAGGSGTFATFNAEVTNSGNTFASGTLFLHDTPNGGTVCKSEDDLTNNTYSSCTFLFNADLSGGSQTATLALNNPGTHFGHGSLVQGQRLHGWRQQRSDGYRRRVRHRADLRQHVHHDSGDGRVVRRAGIGCLLRLRPEHDAAELRCA